MNETQTIRRRRDGSIDTAHYSAQGRMMRSEAARDMLRASQTASLRPRRQRPALVLALLALLPFFGAKS